jgi:hypothetical protein
LPAIRHDSAGPAAARPESDRGPRRRSTRGSRAAAGGRGRRCRRASRSPRRSCRPASGRWETSIRGAAPACPRAEPSGQALRCAGWPGSPPPATTRNHGGNVVAGRAEPGGQALRYAGSPRPPASCGVPRKPVAATADPLWNRLVTGVACLA